MATRQTSSNGRPKSPRIQVVLPEELCERLAALAEEESRTVSNMAKVLIQQGVEALEQQRRRPQAGQQRYPANLPIEAEHRTERFREVLEQQEKRQPSRLRGAPKRLRVQRPRES